MKPILSTVLCIAVLMCVSACSKSQSTTGGSPLKTTKDGKTVVRLQQQWFANSGFAGEIVASKETAAKNGIALQIIPGSDQIDTKQVVKLGEAEFGVAGAEQVLQANEKAGANLVVVGVINHQSLACFISKKAKGILKPQDFQGHKIGTMEGSPVDLVYQALKLKQHLEIPKDDEIPTQWVTTGFIKDQYDVYPAFINDEPITLRKQGIEVNIVQPSYYGVNFIGTVYFCRRDFVDAHPEVVQNFINAISEGWELAMEDPKKAITYLKEYDANIDVDKEMESLLSGREYYKGEDGKVLYCTEATWDRMAKLLKEIGALKQPFVYNQLADNRFVTWYHSKVAQHNR